eukprot:TRINITY_DN22471_c0_g1_i1.p1 TRINITY_DN22471_c0_g1~~TRINITY_DN22471_c0_g1_i1.p1  ORF type:complete len:1474 (-),score=230.31 TRINITY_DN22471_c0_g1_i1:26-4447(-)
MQEYVVGFRIFEGRSLQTEDGSPCDPFVVVECCDNVYQTETLTERNSLAPWNETCIWPKIEMYPKEFESSFIEFKVYARHWFTRNYLIGTASLQLSFINRRQNHLYARRLLNLRREDSTAIMGMLCVTVYVLLPGELAPNASLQVSDESADADAEENEDKEEEDNLQSTVLQTGIVALPGKPHYLRLNIHRVEDLQDVSYSVGPPSPYVTVEFGGCLVKTSTGKNVSQHTFNECLQIPVTTPVYEDTVIMKLWHYSWMSSDVLLAQGLMSFSELRSNSLPPKWFNLYGWSSDEVNDDTIINSGDPEPNVFRGRVLISGHVERLGQDDELQPAKSVPARSVAEPQMTQLSILTDIYMVAGVDARQCQVEVSFGSVKNVTKWVSYDTDSNSHDAVDSGDGEEQKTYGDERTGGQTYTFNEKNGRVEQLLVMTPENPECQPFVMINLYVQGRVQGPRRIAFAKCNLEDFPTYGPGDPSKPRFVPLELIPGYGSGSQASPSVLLAISWTKDLKEARSRSARKVVKPMVYVLRAYCFMARNINYKGIRRDVPGEHLGLKVSCAGMAQRTRAEQGPRVRWMQPLELRIVLSSDSRNEEPASEPILLTLWGGGAVTNFDIGKAVCVYSKLRLKNARAKWEPYHLMPQWIKLFGGPSGSCVAEVLIAFELLLAKHRHEPALEPKDMWPAPPPLFEKAKHFCSLRKATLHVSLLGLRDICPLPRLESIGSAGGKVHAAHPSVTVRVVSVVNADTDEMDPALRKALEEKLIFHFGDGATPEMGERHHWLSNAGSIGQECTNFEFLSAGKMRVLVPDAMEFQPYILIQVDEQPSSIGASLGYTPTTIGETLVGLPHLLPCCWLEGVSLQEPFEEQRPLIEKNLQAAIRNAQVRDKFRSATELELKMESERRQTNLDVVGEKRNALFSYNEEEAPFLDDQAMPKPLRLGQRRPQPHQLSTKLNMQREASFSPREGSRGTKGSGARPSLNGELEYHTSKPFKQDFWYRGLPLRRNHDIIDDMHSTKDWHFQAGEVFGFVKCSFKLVDGWEGEDKVAEGPDDEATAIEDVPPSIDEARESDQAKLKCSYNFDASLDKFAFDEKELYRKYRDPDEVPARIRVRMYFVKAVCMFGNGSEFADPFLHLELGKDIVVSMRNMAKPQTNTPEFYRVEERDIKMPEQARLEVTVKSVGSDFSLADPVIGGTVIDLEDRWHSTTWTNSVRNIPVESRSLYSSEHPGRNCGCIQMWVEMLDSAEAADTKASLLAEPPQAEIELRLVIWGASGVSMMAGDYTNVMVTTMLDCKEYGGEYGNPQSTDVHYNSKDGKAIFNWRMVYPRIKMPTWSCTLLISLYHHELVQDTFIGNVNLDLKKYMEKVSRNSDALIVGPNDVKIMSSSDAQDCVGSINMSMHVLSQPEADSKRAGIAREEPNEDPQLICPIEGRDWGTYLETFGFAWPDFGLWKKLIPLLLAGVVFLFTAVLMRQVGLF